MTAAFDLDGIRKRLAAMVPRTIADDAMARAAVLVPLCTRAGEPAILFTKRTETVGTHKGQVSFPGGRMDPGDKDDVACALRELEEELGIPARDVDVLGLFHEMPSITNMRVRPVIGFVGERADPSSMTPSPAEIDAVFALTLDELTGRREVRPLPLGRQFALQTPIPGVGGLASPMPAARSGHRGPWYTAGPHPVWGLTAFILEEVLRDVLGLDVPPLD